MLTAVGLSLVIAGPAQAHSALISSTPAEGEQVYAPPAAVTLEFNEDIQEIGNEIVIAGPDGTEVTDGDPGVDGVVVTQSLAAPADAEGAIGTYTVTWRVVSSDGHPISGEFTFEVLRGTMGDTVTEEDTTEETTTGATSAASSSDSGESLEDEDTGSDFAVPIVIGLAVLVLAGVIVLVVRRRRAR